VTKYRCRLCNLPIRDPDEHLKHNHILLSFSADAGEYVEAVADAGT
jgi:hypothetical protein